MFLKVTGGPKVASNRIAYNGFRKFNEVIHSWGLFPSILGELAVKQKFG